LGKDIEMGGKLGIAEAGALFGFGSTLLLRPLLRDLGNGVNGV
jgi:hypothetical protein